MTEGPEAPRRASHSRYSTLDALRGVAALIVVWFHMALQGWLDGFGKGYLAVDMFFLLSGFVLAHANDASFAQGQTASDFLLRRVIRLYPLYLVGFLLGAIAIVFVAVQGGSPAYAAGALVTNLLLLPAPSLHHAWLQAFPGNGPGWSLFFELWVANLAFALFWKRLRGTTLIGVIVISGVALVASRIAYDDMGGPLLSNLPGGLARVIFSFFAGVLLCRAHVRYKPRPTIPGWLIVVALCVSLSLQPGDGVAGVVYDMLCVAIVFPALIYFGAEAKTSRPWLGVALGNISYGVYVIHAPLFNGLSWTLSRAGVDPGYGVALAFLLTVAGAAYLLDRYYDRVIRRWLTSRFAVRKAQSLSGKVTMARTPLES